MTVLIQPAPPAPAPVRAVPRFGLVGPCERAYEFADLGATVRVRRFESHRPVQTFELSRPAARSRWAWLRHLGYTPGTVPF